MLPRSALWFPTAQAAVLTCLALASCTVTNDTHKPAPPEAGDPAPVPADPAPAKVAAGEWNAFEPWASPIDDYLAVGDREQPDVFNRAITDLAPLGDRLFIGYGDANYNLGTYIPIEFRWFGSPEDPAVHTLDIAGQDQGAKQSTPRQSGEEQIDRYRLLDGELWQAGIDSTDSDELWTQARTSPKAIEGNVYRIDGDIVRKHRTIPGGEHVHDIEKYKGALYAVGSGADTRTEFEAGRVFRYLWRSTDRGSRFETVKRIETVEPKKHDTRYIHLLPTSGKLYVFGYEVTFSTNAVETKNVTFDGNAFADVAATDPLVKVIPDGTLPLPDGTGLVWGADLASTGFRSMAGHVDANGALTKIAALGQSTVLDVSLTDTDEILFVTTAGDRRRVDPKTWDVRVFVADAKTPGTVTEILQLSTAVRPTAIAHFGGALFLGTADGKVLRAVRK